MAVRFEWANPDHIVMYCYIEHPWTWQEFQSIVDVMAVELQQETHHVATIVDVSNLKTLPKGGNVMQNLQRVENLLPENVFASIVVGAPHVVVTFMNVLTQIKPRAKKISMFANTIEEAHLLLAKHYNILYPDKQAENKFAISKK